ncbi:MAG TPA: quinone-dependent dihydroorotate dehydrogenase [Haliscomenobacter sp.]|uniref:quinone-dependent dihydroorotate dehydrogenase n=1 Tax=Haliscomenobacter sp. TaxID=2717303 RepID=UPI002CD19586|nr:quinone-dependent dihydroorotate dehydrogenase [Haliscomenobacter sp.]HOY15842.1 quinone-dependent dihydroorotate dehydrogenase [Haliscomenobacter sp.]HPH17371.1 quinone-dependent dihydroorotate dehydrogenase [Haliscomenobacter sp.]
MTFYQNVLKPILFRIAPERAHHITVALLKLGLAIPGVGSALRKAYQLEDARLECHFLGLKFKNPVGLAAGFDKDGTHYQAMATLGFGFVELGTVTPKPQDGNPQPRLFRLPEDEALINRMGFNNAGVDALVEQLKKPRPQGLVIGGNIGKNKSTPNEKALLDYLYCFDRLFPFVDYFVVNVSSPNTPDLRALQEKEPLTELLTALQQKNHEHRIPTPILLKIAPDLNEQQLDDILEIVQTTGIAGVIATNTTIGREGLISAMADVEEIGAGGLSGHPLRERATEVIRYLHQKSEGNLFIIGVGGIASAQDAIEKLEAGASLVQVYSGLVYAGPGLVKEICAGILAK